MTTPPTGWHPDPDDPTRERWWDAASGQWLEHSRDAGGPPGTGAPGQTPRWAQTRPAGGERQNGIRTALGNGWKKFRALPPRTQAIATVVVVVVFAVFGIIGAVTDNAEKARDAEAASKSPTTTGTSVAEKTAPQETAAPPPAAEPPEQTTPAKPPPPTYPGSLDNDAVANELGEVEVRGLTTTIGPLRRIPPTDFDADRLCSDLNFQNRSSETQYYDSSDFTIQYPSGNEKGQLLVYQNDVGTGNLVPGGQTSGQVCFNDRQEIGQHLVFWNRTDLSSFSTPRRGVWILN